MTESVKKSNRELTADGAVVVNLSDLISLMGEIPKGIGPSHPYPLLYGGSRSPKFIKVLYIISTTSG